MNAYAKIQDRLRTISIVPVIHGVDLELVELQCRQVARLGSPKIVGIGGNVSLFKSLTRNSRYGRNSETQLELARAFLARLSMVRQLLPESAVHVFGAGGFLSFALCCLGRANTFDSASWRLRAAFGAVLLTGGRQLRVPASHEDTEGMAQRLIAEGSLCSCPICVQHLSNQDRACVLARSFKARALHNLFVLLEDVALLRIWLQSKAEKPIALQRWRLHPRFPFLGQLLAEQVSNTAMRNRRGSPSPT